VYQRPPTSDRSEIEIGDLAGMEPDELGAFLGAEDSLEEVAGMLGNPGWFAKIKKKVTKAIKPGSKFRKRLKKAADYIKKNGSKIVTSAATAISTVFPAAAPVAMAAAKVINKGLDKLKTKEGIAKAALDFVKGTKGKQSNLLDSVEKAAAWVADRKKKGLPIPSKIRITKGAVEKGPGVSKKIGPEKKRKPALKVKKKAAAPRTTAARRERSVALREHAPIQTQAAGRG